MDALIFCKNFRYGLGKTKGTQILKRCRKKYCASCLQKYFKSQIDCTFSKNFENFLSKFMHQNFIFPYKIPIILCHDLVSILNKWATFFF